MLFVLKNVVILQREKRGTIAQLVEQRTENPCVAGSTPAGTTKQNANRKKINRLAFFVFIDFEHFLNFCQRNLFVNLTFVNQIVKQGIDGQAGN